MPFTRITTERKGEIDVFNTDKENILTGVVLADCGGHPCVISILQSVIAKETTHSEVNGTNITRVMTATCSELNTRYEMALTWPSEVFEAALHLILSRSVVDHQYKIPGTEVTVDSLLAPGLV